MRFALRAQSILTLAGESPARGLPALDAPLSPLQDGVIRVCGTRIEAVESYPSFKRRGESLPLMDFGKAVLAPGFINSHCHLELSHLAGKTLSGQGFVPWLKSLVALTATPPSRNLLDDGLSSAVAQLAVGGTAHVGDVGSRFPLAVAEALTRNIPGRAFPAGRAPVAQGIFLPASASPGEPLRLTRPAVTATHFLEIFGFSMPREDLPPSLAAGGYAPPAAATLPEYVHPACAVSGHSLYSAHPKALQAAHAWSREHTRPFSLHLAESPEETVLLRDGRGALYEFFQERVLPDAWQAPGSTPALFAEQLGLLGPETLAVHCTQCEKEDIDALQNNGVSCCLCPRSNLFIGVGLAPARNMARAGILLCLGTDGLSSNRDLDMNREMDAARSVWNFSAQAVLRMTTVNGAHALGLSRELGSLAPGKRAAFSLVTDLFQ